MSIPDVIVQVGFASDASQSVADTTWTDVSDYVSELPGGGTELVRTVRGKQYEFDEFQAGTVDLVLDNRDGRFSPDNTASPYWPNVKPMRRVRVLADGYLDTYSDSYGEPVFSGFVDQWPQQWLSHAAVQVSVAASDGFKVLHNVGLESSVYAWEVTQDSPAHWWRLGEQSGSTAVDVGQSSRMHDGTYAGSPTLGASSLVEHDPDSGVQFDGVDDEVQISGSALPKQAMQAAVEVVFQPASLPAAGQRMALVVGPEIIANSTNPWLSLLIRDDGSLDFVFRINDAAYLFSGRVNSAFSPGSTYHLLLVIDADVGSDAIYINGVDQTVTSTTSLDATQTGLMLLGGTDGIGDQFGTVQHFDGIISEFALYENDLGWFDPSVGIDPSRIEAHANAVGAPWNGELSGTRIGRALDIASWPAADRDLDGGATNFQDASFADDETVLGFVQRAAMSEYGYFYVGPDSDAKFIGRHNLLTEARYTTSQGTFSDQPTGAQLPYADLQLDPSSDATVVNDWTVQRKFGPEQSVSDAASIDAYFERSQSRTALMMDNDAEARAQAEWLLAHTKDPVTRIRRLTLDPAGNDDLWVQVLGRELMDRVTVNYRIPGGGSESKEAHIIGIEHRISKGRWMCDWWLSPADTQSYLILDDAAFGTLDANRLGY